MEQIRRTRACVRACVCGTQHKPKWQSGIESLGHQLHCQCSTDVRNVQAFNQAKLFMKRHGKSDGYEFYISKLHLGRLLHSTQFIDLLMLCLEHTAG